MYYENHTQSTVIKKKTRNTLGMWPFCPLRSLYAATPDLAATVQSLVTDVRYTVLIRLPIIAQCSKGTHYFHRVVGLVVSSISVVCIFTLSKSGINLNISPGTSSQMGIKN